MEPLLGMKGMTLSAWRTVPDVLHKAYRRLVLKREGSNAMAQEGSSRVLQKMLGVLGAGEEASTSKARVPGRWEKPAAGRGRERWRRRNNGVRVGEKLDANSVRSVRVGNRAVEDAGRSGGRRYVARIRRVEFEAKLVRSVRIESPSMEGRRKRKMKAGVREENKGVRRIGARRRNGGVKREEGGDGEGRGEQKEWDPEQKEKRESKARLEDEVRGWLM